MNYSRGAWRLVRERKRESNDKISHALSSLIMNDGSSLHFGHYVSDVFDTNTVIWWHCDDDNVTQICYFLEGVYNRESHKKQEKGVISGSKYILLRVYIRTIYLIKTSSIFCQEFANMSKINHTYKVIKDLNVFRKYFRVRQEVGDEIKTSFFLVNMSFKLPLKLIYLVKNKRKIIFVEWGWNKKFAHYESYGKIYHKKEHNIRKYHISG